MTYFAYVAYMVLGTMMASSVWLWTLFQVNPESSGLAGVFLFYVSFGLMLIGLCALIGLFVRVMVLRGQDMRVLIVKTTFRQAVLLAVMAEGLLVFQRLGFLTWWSFVLLFMLVISLEFFLSAGHHVKHV